MIVIDQAEAQDRLHDIWRAVLTKGEVHFVDQGIPILRMVWTGTDEDRIAVEDELAHTIGFQLNPVP